MKTEVVICGAPFDDKNIREILRQMKEDGVTSVQIYVHWNKFEGKARGHFDFSAYDYKVDLLKEAGLKFVPFFIMGPRYSAPSWWLKDPNFVPLTCLEHGKDCPIDSIWNPAFQNEVDRVMKAFAEHYLPMDVIEFFLPGITGDYGEALMPVHGNWPNAYHNHLGYWCGGQDARRSFREWLSKKFGTVEAMNTAWRSAYHSFDEVQPFLRPKAPSMLAWFDMMDWYRASMNDYIDFWLKTSKKYFPNTPIYLCTGGWEMPGTASLLSDQTKIAAKNGCGIRLTNEASDFYNNFLACNAYTHSACELYDVPLGLEPAGAVNELGVPTRIFSSAVYGNRQIFFYFGNIYPNKNMKSPQAHAFRKYISLVQECKSDKKTAVFWPKYVGMVDGGRPKCINLLSKFIRQRTDFHFVNENMVADGMLDKLSLLIMPSNAYGDLFTDKETAHRICRWVEQGGVLLNIGRITDLDQEPIEEYDRMIGLTEASDYCQGVASFAIPEDIPFRSFAAKKSYTSADPCYSNLAPDVMPLAANPGEVHAAYEDIVSKPTYSSFYRKYGKGLVITYMGYVIMDDPTIPLPELLDDVLKNHSKDLRICEGEIARGEIGGKCYALMQNGEIKEVE